MPRQGERLGAFLLGIVGQLLMIAFVLGRWGSGFWVLAPVVWGNEAIVEAGGGCC